jgi:hypothetical protein
MTYNTKFKIGDLLMFTNENGDIFMGQCISLMFSGEGRKTTVKYGIRANQADYSIPETKTVKIQPVEVENENT